MPLPDVALPATAHPEKPRRRRSPTPPPSRLLSFRVGTIITLQDMPCDLLNGCQAVIVSRLTPRSWRVRLLAPVPSLPFTLPPAITVSRSNMALDSPFPPDLSPTTAASLQYVDVPTPSLPGLGTVAAICPFAPSRLPCPTISLAQSTPNDPLRIGGNGTVLPPRQLHFSLPDEDPDLLAFPKLPPVTRLDECATRPTVAPRQRPHVHLPTFETLPDNLVVAAGPLQLGDIVRLRNLRHTTNIGIVGSGSSFNHRLGLLTELSIRSAVVHLPGTPAQTITVCPANLQRIERIPPPHTGSVGAFGATPPDSEHLPPPWGIGHIVDRPIEPAVTAKIFFKVDSGCEPYDIISEAALPPGTTTVPFHSILTLADGVTKITSSRAAVINLRVLIGDRPRIFVLRPVIWPADKAPHPLLIGQTTAMRTALSLFVHDNTIRAALLGTAAFSHLSDDNPADPPPSIVGTIGLEDDAALMERISPIEGFRAAMEPPTPTDDFLVNEFMLDPEVGPVFGPPAQGACKD